MGSFGDLSDSSQFSQGWQIANTVLYAQEESQFLVYNGCLRMLGCTSSRTLVEGRNSPVISQALPHMVINKTAN